MRRISLVLDGSARDHKSSAAAIAIARRLGAQIEAFFIRPSTGEIMARFGDSIMSSVSGEIVEEILKDADEFAAKANLLLENAARASGLAVFDKPSRQSAPGVSFQIVQGPPLDALDGSTALSDLVVFSAPDGTAPTSFANQLAEQIEYTMLTLRRPVLVARGEMDFRFAERIVVAFDGRHESCTALMRALPILTAAKAVEILHLRERDTVDLNAADGAVRYLGQNGIAASAVEAQAASGEIGAEIAELAKINDASLIVMGGYGRSRMRELILGGATRYMMRHSPMPVFFAH